MKRFAVARIVPDAVNGGYTTAADAMGLNANGPQFPVSPTTGIPTVAWVLRAVAGADLTGLSTNPDVIPVPDATRDSSLSVIPTATWDAFVSRLSGWGITLAVRRRTNGGNTVRDLLNELARRHAPASFEIDSVDVRDIEP
jgi:hypothetical protein